MYDRTMKKAVLSARSILVRFEVDPDAPEWHRDHKLVFIDVFSEHYDDENRQTFGPFPGKISAGHRDDWYVQSWPDDPVLTHDAVIYSKEWENIYAPNTGSWQLFVYQFADCPVQSIFRSIPVNSKLVFRAGLDSGTSEVLTEHGLHGDCLYLETRHPSSRKGRTFTLDHRVGPHNTARFGFPYQEWAGLDYKAMHAADARSRHLRADKKHVKKYRDGSKKTFLNGELVSETPPDDNASARQ